MNPDIFRGLMVLLLALLLCGQALRAPGQRRRAFLFASGGIALMGVANLTAGFGFAAEVGNLVAAVGVGLIIAGLFFLFRSWQSGELRHEVERYRQTATDERSRRERDQKSK